MNIDIKRIAVVSGNMKTAFTGGVVQFRDVDPRGRLVKEGAFLLALQTEKGEQVHVVLDPNECAEMAQMLIVGGAQSCGALMPVLSPDVIAKPSLVTQ